MSEKNNILVIQTAFLGDVILTLPMVQVLKRSIPSARVDVLAVPPSAELLSNHPDIRSVLVYDKHGRDSGLRKFWMQVQKIRLIDYGVALIPHRSFRSAALARMANIPLRIGFDKSAGKLLLTKVIRYDPSAHEVARNLSLLSALGIEPPKTEFPQVVPSSSDVDVVDRLFHDQGVAPGEGVIAIAPGTIWNTKRWLKERFVELAQMLIGDQFRIMVIGGSRDRSLCEEIVQNVGSPSAFSCAGKLSLLQSCELIRRSRLLISNDSAPVHMAAAMRTPVVAIFGATVPRFGFSPLGDQDAVVECRQLSCRPCSTHGGDSCPIKTFDCMRGITVQEVYEKARGILLMMSSPTSK